MKLNLQSINKLKLLKLKSYCSSYSTSFCSFNKKKFKKIWYYTNSIIPLSYYGIK